MGCPCLKKKQTKKFNKIKEQKKDISKIESLNVINNQEEKKIEKSLENKKTNNLNIDDNYSETILINKNKNQIKKVDFKKNENNISKEINIKDLNYKDYDSRNTAEITYRNKNSGGIILKENKDNDISSIIEMTEENVVLHSNNEKERILKRKKNDNDTINKNKKPKEVISLGINIGASKTVYSIFSKINNKYVFNVLLMNNSSRIIPSIICYTKDHRLFGDNCISSLKQNLNTSYNNLSRLIGYNKNDNIFKEEIKFMFSKENNLEKIGSECIIADYLSLINKYYFEKENIEYDYTIISVPDFYTPNQKQELKLICESIGMKDIKIINESTSITMYYGYNKYRDLFANGNDILDNIEKYILFVDVGYSKTSFILSYFKYNEFRVEYVKCIPNFGARIFDERICDYCINKFKQEKNLNDLEVTDKMKHRLYEVISKQRQNLSINDEVKISVDSFYEDYDLDINIKIEEFEKEIILKEISFENLFLQELKNIKSFIDENNIKLNSVEIAGEFMRTPILQKKIEEIYEDLEKNINTKKKNFNNNFN